MTLRLGEYVVYGEIYNFRNFSTHGVLALRGEEPGEETIVHLELTGNVGPDSQKIGMRFWPEEEAEPCTVFVEKEHRGFQVRQIGVTGEMTAQGWVRTLPCPVEEFMRRSKLGEPPPTEWKRRLFLEWFSQNGRVVVEMAAPVVEECIRVPKDEDEGEWVPLPNLAPHPWDGEPEAGTSLGISAIRREEDGFTTEHWQSRGAPPRREEECCDCGGDALQRHLDAETRAVDRAIRGHAEPAEDDDIAEMELIDYCFEHCEGEPLGDLFPDSESLPGADELDDEAVEEKLKGLLARLALFGVALGVCEHYTPRDCYRLLVEQILPDHSVYKELIGTGWVTHFTTHEFCDACEEECLRDYEEFEKRRGER